jgi:hypothetical protein
MFGPNLARLVGLAAAVGGLFSATINGLNFAFILSMSKPLEGITYGVLSPLLAAVDAPEAVLSTAGGLL